MSGYSYLIEIKSNFRKKAGTVIGVCCNLACLLSALIAPFMPSTTKELRGQLGLTQKDYGYIPEVVSIMIQPGHTIGKPSPLFSKIEDKKIAELRKKYAGKQDSTPPITTNVLLEAVDAASLEAAIGKQVIQIFIKIFLLRDVHYLPKDIRKRPEVC